MAAFERITTTFTRGELSPRILARVDFDGRFDGVEKLENFLVHVQGGAQKRSGLRFVAAAKDEVNNARLIPFEVSVLQNYIIEATNTTFRFYTDEGRLESPPGTPVEVSTPYTSGQLPGLKWAQSADILFMAHEAHAPRQLRRTSPTAFNVSAYAFNDGPYLDHNATATTLILNPGAGAGTISSDTTGVVVRASATAGINDGNGFSNADVNRVIRIEKRDASGWTWLKVTGFTSATEVTATLRGSDALQDEATTSWRLGAWGGDQGWPSVCTFHQARLWWGRTPGQPQTLWASRVAAFHNFSPSAPADEAVTESHAITLTIDSNQVNAIAWLVSSQRGLQIGSTGEDWLLRSADNTSGLSPLNAELVPQGAWGSDDTVLPVRVGTSSLYVQRGSTVIRESAFSFDEDSYTANNITVLSEHMFRQGIDRLEFAQTPIQTVWAVLNDGSLAGFTFDKEQRVHAWHHHTVAGASAKVLDVAVVKRATQDQLWLIVRRTIDGQQHQYVEFMEEPFDTQLHNIEDAFFIDSGLSYSGTPITVVSGLDHLEGETVAVLADGAVQPSKVVSSGQITLDRSASDIHVGLPFTSAITTMPLEAPQREGSFVTLGKTKRIHQVQVLFAETVGAKIGPFGGALDVVAFRKPPDLMDQPVPLFDGIKRMSLSSVWEDSPRVNVVSDQPLPCTVLAIVAESQINAS